MLLYVIKVVLSAVLIVIVTEISKKNTLLGSIVLSIPWVSVIAILWLYIETGDAAKTASFSSGIFWMVIPSLALFVILPLMLKMKINFYASLLASTAVMTACYFAMNMLLNKIGIKI